MANISSLGIGSGVLNSSLVDKLVSAERKATDTQISSKTDTVKAEISAFGKVSSALTDMRLPARTLSEPGALNILKGTSGNSAVGVSVDSSKASPGSYSVAVQSLAMAQSLASGAVSNADSATLGTGTLTIQVGGNTQTINVDSSNNSLNGLAKSINQANSGVSASVVNTGSGYRLVLSSDKTGTDNAMSITVSDGDGNNTDMAGLSQLAYNSTTKNLSQTVAAQDAKLTVNGISVTRSSNQVDNVISGVTLNLSGTTSAPASVSVTQDTGAAADKVQSFIDKYNALQSTVKTLTAYDPSQQSGSVLTGDPTVNSIMNQLRSTLGQVVPGLGNASVRSLADVGITTDANTGQLQFDRNKFISQLQQNPSDVEALFSSQGRASDAGISVTSLGTAAQAGSYDVNISQAATQGKYTGTGALNSSITIDSTNDTFGIKVDGGTAATIKLTQGTYTPATLVQEIQTQLDSNSSLNSQGLNVSVGLDASNHLTFTSGAYGSDSNVSITSAGSGVALALGLSVADGTAGKDVAGTVNGQSASGSGQVLSVGGSGPAQGMVLKVTGAKTGPRGSITSIEGMGKRVVDFVTNAMDINGLVTNKNNSYQKQLDELNKKQTDLNNRMDAYKKQLVQEFTAADARVSQYNSTLNYLQAQFGGGSSASSKGSGSGSGSGG